MIRTWRGRFGASAIRNIVLRNYGESEDNAVDFNGVDESGNDRVNAAAMVDVQTLAARYLKLP